MLGHFVVVVRVVVHPPFHADRADRAIDSACHSISYTSSRVCVSSSGWARVEWRRRATRPRPRRCKASTPRCRGQLGGKARPLGRDRTRVPDGTASLVRSRHRATSRKWGCGGRAGPWCSQGRQVVLAASALLVVSSRAPAVGSPHGAPSWLACLLSYQDTATQPKRLVGFDPCLAVGAVSACFVG